jgi:hypothetical protein
LLPLCAYYLVEVTRDGEPDDSVARFHLRNGARLERINWLGNPSPAGLRQSAGLMVNYLYWSRRPGAGYDAWSVRPGRHASRLVEQLACSVGPSAGGFHEDASPAIPTIVRISGNT